MSSNWSRERTKSRNIWYWRGVQRACTRAGRSRRVVFRYNAIRREGRKRVQKLVEANQRNHIRLTYQDLSAHFDVPVPKWVILPKSKAPIIRSALRILVPLRKRSIDIINESKPSGLFQDSPYPQIRLFGRPTDNTVLHEFMHYLVYRTERQAREEK